jgi:3-deoxy-7-phosphoheptulonate synthase
MIDCSHGNSRKQHARQAEVADDVAVQVSAGDRALFGVMIESFLEDGRQDWNAGGEMVYGQSITDACISWERTLPVLDALAAAVRSRRKA